MPFYYANSKGVKVSCQTSMAESFAKVVHRLTAATGGFKLKKVFIKILSKTAMSESLF